MLKLVYNIVLMLIGILALPKLLWDWFVHRKYRKSLLERLGLKAPQLDSKDKGPRIWIHAVSMGETRAVAPLVKKIRQEFPDAAVYFSSTTETGQEEGKRSFPGLEGYLYLPLDFSWTVSRLVKQMRPDLLILCESDFWYNLLDAVPNVVLVNGKISERSFNRFKRFSFFAKRLFDCIDLLCLQSGRYAERFQALGVDPKKIVVTGNLKFDQQTLKIDRDKWKTDLGLSLSDIVLTLGSTHAPEEEELLDALEHLCHDFPNLKIVVVPRHPERFDAVAGIFEKRGISFARYSQISSAKGTERILLMDAMGLLTRCYQVSDLAVVAGSFGSLVGGHNIFEPAALGVPVLFGPHMESQKDLVEIIVSAGAGKQVELPNIAKTVLEILRSPQIAMKMKEAGLGLAKEVFGATDRTWERVKPLIQDLVK